MAPYRVDIGSRSRTVGRFVARVRNELLKAVKEERDASKINSQGVANRLDWHRSAVNRQLSGDAPLTLRSVAELSWALGREINFELHKPVQEPGQNFNMETPDDITGPINLGNPGEFTIRQLAETIIELTGSSSRLVSRPLPQDDPRQRQPDLGRANSILGWQPTTRLRDGLALVIDYFRSLQAEELPSKPLMKIVSNCA